MSDDYWLRQTVDKPLFPELVWSRPENKNQAGKLLIIGGNSFGFAAVGQAYADAVEAGVGTARVLLPQAVRKVVGHVLEHAEFATSNPSGSFSKDALGEFLAQAVWADGVLLAGDFGRNSETAVLLEQFVQKYSGQLTLTKDAVNYFLDNARLVYERPETTLVITMGQLQKLAKSLRFTTPITSTMDTLRLVEALHELTLRYPVTLVTKHFKNVLVTYGGKVSTTALMQEQPIWCVKTASTAAIWWLQNTTKPFESMTVSLVTH